MRRALARACAAGRPAAAITAALALPLAACGSGDDAATNAAAPLSAPPAASSQPVAANEVSPAAAPAGDRQADSANACLMQGGERLSVAPLRGLGTEPFWAVRIEGRCVTYSHPEDQAGTRVWTRHTPGPGGGTWSGVLGGRPFELRIRAEPGCSDGMSDNRYPLAVELTVQGELRHGCAKPM